MAARAIRVPFVDLERVNAPLRDSLLAGFSSLLERGNFIGGPEVESFETAFAAYCGSARCVGTSSGLDALRLGLLAAGLESGDEVIVPANTFIATFEAVVAGRRDAGRRRRVARSTTTSTSRRRLPR